MAEFQTGFERVSFLPVSFLFEPGLCEPLRRQWLLRERCGLATDLAGVGPGWVRRVAASGSHCDRKVNQPGERPC